MLSLGRGSRKVFFLARLRGRSILGLRINFFNLDLCFLCLSCSFLVLANIFGFWGELFLLVLTFVFGLLNPLALITSLVGSFWSHRKRESTLGSQGLLRGLWSKGRGRRDETWDFTDIWVIIYAPRLPPNRIYKDSCNIKGPIPCCIAIIPLGLGKLLSEPNLCFFYAEQIGHLLLSLNCLLRQLSCFLCLLQLCLQIQRKLPWSGQL